MLTFNTDHTSSTQASLLTTFQQVAAEIAGKAFSHVSEVTRLSELAVDSLAMVEIIGHLEQRFGISAIPDARLAGLATVGDLLDVVEEHVG
jgi:acyl carrier protein